MRYYVHAGRRGTSQLLEGQADWNGHALFMDRLYDEGMAALVGPLEGTTKQISRWTLRLGSLVRGTEPK